MRVGLAPRKRARALGGSRALRSSLSFRGSVAIAPRRSVALATLTGSPPSSSRAATHPRFHAHSVPRERRHPSLGCSAGLSRPAPATAGAAARSGRSAECRPGCRFVNRYGDHREAGSGSQTKLGTRSDASLCVLVVFRPRQSLDMETPRIQKETVGGDLQISEGRDVHGEIIPKGGRDREESSASRSACGGAGDLCKPGWRVRLGNGPWFGCLHRTVTTRMAMRRRRA
ncbi:uncharacterized protein [Triticum aestivum]|uniref:uncharacterized protein n=1 Tax=Triticum aestivum TaxID=4565 RepID=UPI001D02B73A|nr:uncharacterized protein LOC123139024 [Triticum aestivum]